MKEIVLKVGHARKIENQYRNNVIVGRKQKGYYLIENKKGYGPFKKVFLDVAGEKLNNDKFLVGFNFTESTIYRIGVNGLEFSDKIDTSNELRDIIIDKIDISNHEEFKDCLYFGKIDEYALFADKNNMFFVVNVLDDITTVDNYPKFDSYKDLTAWYRKEKGIKLFSSEMLTLTNNVEYVKIEDITDGVLHVEFNQLNDSSKERITSLQPCLPNENIFRDFYSVIKECLKLKKVFKFTTDKEKDKIKQEGYVRFNFKTLEYFSTKYPTEYKLFEENIIKRYNYLQKEYFINNPSYISELVENCKIRPMQELKFNMTYKQIIDQPYGEEIFFWILKYLGLSDSKINQLTKFLPEVYNLWYSFCENNIETIRKMIITSRIEFFKNQLNISRENINYTKDVKSYKAYSTTSIERIKFIINKLDELEKMLEQLNGELKDVTSESVL